MDTMPPQILTATELARLRGQSRSYIARLCRLPADDPRHIKSIKLNTHLYWITDAKILSLYPGKYCAPSAQQ